MKDKAVAEIQRRFELLGFSDISKEIGTPYQLCCLEGKIRIDFFARNGKLSFALDIAKDIDPTTGNMVAYTGTWKGIIQIPESVVDGMATKLLENKILEFDYFTEPEEQLYEQSRKGVMADLEALRRSKKQEGAQLYQYFIARYGLQYDLAGLQEVASARQSLQKLYAAQRRFSLLPGKVTPPLKAYQQLRITVEKALKKVK
ncbi:hypothetical protein J2T02_002574 [Chitinophaga terrae (ex Kim and Jung 2007)]|uniref:hypothetical protein n=1 Tax=Chitinophaga terrae (ex Kim and Jung 2007) TaxID=408074 RepID=UPI00277F6F7B|nr:hypothetical protein [Chitinophaga terrae (ex Kim and Jung 2007)]MDQ0107455.1 hypothetical protein [Chitinophaga terrae (ex Kim and Jung 2007)]